MQVIINQLKKQSMIKFKLSEANKIIEFSSIGFYNIYFLGGFKANRNKDFDVVIRNLSNSPSVAIIENQLKFRSIIDNNRAINFYTFEIKEVGKYEIEFINVNNFSMSKSMLLFKNWLFPSIVSFDCIEVAIIKN